MVSGMFSITSPLECVTHSLYPFLLTQCLHLCPQNCCHCPGGRWGRDERGGRGSLSLATPKWLFLTGNRGIWGTGRWGGGFCVFESLSYLKVLPSSHNFPRFCSVLGVFYNERVNQAYCTHLIISSRSCFLPFIRVHSVFQIVFCLKIAFKEDAACLF